MLRQLTDVGEVDCVCLADDVVTAQARDILQQHVRRLLIARVEFQPWRSWWQQMYDDLPANVRHWFDPRIIRSIQALFADTCYDAVFLGDLVSVPYAEAANLFNFPCIIDRARVDVASRKQKLRRSNKQRSRSAHRAPSHSQTVRYERYVAAKVQHTIVCADSDQELLRQLIAAKMPITTLVNGIDRDAFPGLWAADC